MLRNQNLLALIVFSLGIGHAMGQQKVGIGTQAPLAMLSVHKDILVDQAGVNANNLTSGALIFGPDFQVGIASPRTIGSSTRMGLDLYTGGQRRVHIDSTGDVGIGTFAPLQRLHVAGKTYHQGNVGIYTSNPQYGLVVNHESHLMNHVGIMTVPTTYALDVGGSVRMQGDIRINGILNPNNALAIGNNTTIEGSLTVMNGKGIVRSTNSTQMKIKRLGVGFSYTGMAANATITSGFMSFGEDFTGATVTVGHCKTPEGAGNEWAKVLIVPFDVDLVNDRCRFRVTNVSNSSISFDADWDIVVIGN